MTQTSENVTWLTQEAYDQLKAELEYLSGPARAEIVAKIEEAREEGDLKENAGYHAATRGPGQAGAPGPPAHPAAASTRKVGEAPADNGVVAPAWSSRSPSTATRTTP